MTSYGLFAWLLNSAIAGTAVLAAGAAACALCRQPADRVRVIQSSFVAALGALVLVAVPQLAAFSLGLLAARDRAPLRAVPSTTPKPVQADEPSRPLSGAAPMTADQPLDRGASRPTFDSAAAGSSEPQRAAPPSAIDWVALAAAAACAAYGSGALVFLIRWARAHIKLVRLLRSTRDVPEFVRAELTRIGGLQSGRVRLLASAQLTGPITFGTRRPVIVIPSAALADPDDTQLRYYLAHEWSHVARGDFATWQLSTLLAVLLYYQPLFWWLRGRLSVCMDQLADADASAEGASTVDYAEFLVGLARLRLAPHPQLTLGIGGRGSSLQQRIVFLLNAAARPCPTCPPARTLAIGAGALLVAGLVSVVRLEAQPSAVDSGAELAAAAKPEQSTKPPEEKSAAEAITYDGTVVNAATKEPIPGVKVKVWRKVSRPWRVVETTEHETDAQGRYSFVIPPEQAAEPYLYLEVEAHHPDYASKSRSGYSHAMIRKNLAAGEPPFYSTIRLWPGEAVTGTIVNPAGQPLADVEVLIYSATSQAKEFPRGSWDETKTDAQGRFRIVPATPGDGVLWIKPAEYVLQAHRLSDRRGDWGTITVETGSRMTGRVLDVEGRPVAGVQVAARRRGDGEKADEFLGANAVAGQITRESVTGSQGEFTLGPLPDGEYSLHVEPVRGDHNYDPPPLTHVFVGKTVTLAGGVTPEPLEIRAVPHVVIRGTYLNSGGKPRTGSEVSLFGRLDGAFFFTRSSTPGEDGKFELLAPHGLEQAELDLITNEHSALRWRMRHDQPLLRGRRIKLKTLEDDISGFEVVRYVAPMLLIKAVDEQGAMVADCDPRLTYTRPAGDGEEFSSYVEGNHVHIEAQPDGRYRTEQLLPDEPFTVTCKKPGYAATSEELSLAEGAQHELVLVLKKDSNGDQPAADKDAKEGE